MDESCGCAAIKWDQQRSVLAVGLGLARCTSLADLAPLVGVLGVFVAHCVRLTVCLAIVPSHLVVAVGAVRGLLCAPHCVPRYSPQTLGCSCRRGAWTAVCASKAYCGSIDDSQLVCWSSIGCADAPCISVND